MVDFPDRRLVAGATESVERPLLSVLIAVYNGAPYLGEALESVYQQEYRPLEVVVVDDGSTDGSAAIARGYGDRLVYAYQENAGDGSARNHATRLASGELLAFLDADDRFTPSRLERMYAALVADPGLDMVFGHVHEFLSPELTEAERAGIRPPADGATAWLAPGGMVIRRESFDRVGPFVESLRLGAVVDWCGRAADAGLRSEVIPDVVLERRLHLTNTTLVSTEHRANYIDVVKAALNRRRALAQEAEDPSAS